MSHRGLGRALLLLVCVLAALVAPATAASAHAYLERSDPADGAVLSRSPAALTLYFSESVEAGATSVTVVDGHARPVRTGAVRLVRAGGSEGDTEAPVHIVVPLPTLARDTYRVSWRTMSSDDLHATSGAIVFGVQHAATAVGSHEAPTSQTEVALRWLTLLAGSLLAGGLLLSRLAPRGSDEGAQVARRALTLGVAGGAGALAATALLLVSLVRDAPGGQWSAVAPSGPRWALTGAGLLLATSAMALARRRQGTRYSALLAGVGLAVAGIGTALLSHAGAGRASSPTRVALTALHILAAQTWAGTLITAAVLGFVLRRRRDPAAAAVLGALRRFALPASACIATMVVTGLLMAGDLVESVDALFFTTYGRALLLKIGVAALAGAVGLVNFSRLRRPGAPSGPRRALLRRTITVEAALAVGVLGYAAILGSSQPALGPAWAQVGDASPPLSRSTGAGDLQETLSVKPNVPGRNVVSLAVHDTRRPSPGRVTGVRVAMQPATGPPIQVVRRATPAGADEWTVAVDDLDRPGRWNVTVTVERAGLAPIAHRYAWAVGRGPGEAVTRVRVSDQPLRGPLRTAGVLLAAALLGAAGTTVSRRRRRAPVDVVVETIPPREHARV